MKALYSLVCRLRTVCAPAQAVATLACDGWAALTPGQLLVLGCAICLVLRVLVLSAGAGARATAPAERLLGALAAVTVLVLATVDAAWICALAGRLVFGA